MIQQARMLEFKALCDRAGVSVPKPILEGLRLWQLASDHQASARAVPIFDLTDGQVRARIEELSLRTHDSGSTRGLAPGMRQFHDEIAHQVREATLPSLEGIVAQMRPGFTKATAPIVDAVKRYDFTSATASDQVITMPDKAIAAWRTVREVLPTLRPYVEMRAAMSEILEVSPTIGEFRDSVWLRDQFRPSLDERPNYSVCFASGDNWSLGNGYTLQSKLSGPGSLDLLAIAKGGMRLNSPDEVRAKIDKRASSH